MTISTPAPTAYAHYFATRGRAFVVISNDARPVGKEIPVDGKVQARRVAAEHNAKPYNF